MKLEGKLDWGNTNHYWTIVWIMNNVKYFPIAKLPNERILALEKEKNNSIEQK